MHMWSMSLLDLQSYLAMVGVPYMLLLVFDVFHRSANAKSDLFKDPQGSLGAAYWVLGHGQIGLEIQQ